MKCSAKQLRIAPNRIHFLKFILEGYDGLAVLSTIDRKIGLVEVHYPATREKEVVELLQALRPDILPDN